MSHTSPVSDRDASSESSLDATWQRLAKAQVRRRRALGVLAVAAVCLLPWINSAWPERGWVNQGLEWFGLALMVVAVLGRCACMLYLGGRKGADLVSDGPYSVSRNPLYVFSILAVLGIGLQTGSLIVGVALALLAGLIFHWIIGEEELLLRQAFGASFDAYCRRVPRFFPKCSLWHSSQHVNVDLQGVWKTLRDALPYFLAIPVFEAIEAAQQAGWVHVYWSLF